MFTVYQGEQPAPACTIDSCCGGGNCLLLELKGVPTCICNLTVQLLAALKLCRGVFQIFRITRYSELPRSTLVTSRIQNMENILCPGGQNMAAITFGHSRV